MWVWIPRYAYNITSGYHSGSAGNIEVEFMKGLTNRDKHRKNNIPKFKWPRKLEYPSSV